jgi:hypothetical protein
MGKSYRTHGGEECVHIFWSENLNGRDRLGVKEKINILKLLGICGQGTVQRRPNKPTGSWATISFQGTGFIRGGVTFTVI